MRRRMQWLRVRCQIAEVGDYGLAHINGPVASATAVLIPSNCGFWQLPNWGWDHRVVDLLQYLPSSTAGVITEGRSRRAHVPAAVDRV